MDGEIKKETDKVTSNYDGTNETEWVKGECSECGEYKKVDSESGLCKYDKAQFIGKPKVRAKALVRLIIPVWEKMLGIS